jgi:hypothetical protein
VSLEIKNRFQLYLKCPKGIASTGLAEVPGVTAGTLTLGFFPGFAPDMAFEVWIGKQKPVAASWEYTRVSNVVKFD